MNYIEERQKLHRKLTRQKKKMLVEIIERLLQTDGELESIVQICIDQESADDTFEDEIMRMSADDTFDLYEIGWRNTDSLVSDLERLELEVDVMMDHGRTRAAASGYAGLILSIAAHQEWQDECEFEYLFENCCEALKKCIDAEQDPEISKRMIGVFGAVLRLEVTVGGYGLDDLVGPIFIALASETQRREWVEDVSRRFQRLENAAREPSKYRRSSIRSWIKKLLPKENPAEWVVDADLSLLKLKAEVELHIRRGKRAAYIEACDAMKKVQTYFHKQGDDEAFTTYLAEIRSYHSSLRSLRSLMDSMDW